MEWGGLCFLWTSGGWNLLKSKCIGCLKWGCIDPSQATSHDLCLQFCHWYWTAPWKKWSNLMKTLVVEVQDAHYRFLIYCQGYLRRLQQRVNTKSTLKRTITKAVQCFQPHSILLSGLGKRYPIKVSNIIFLRKILPLLLGLEIYVSPMCNQPSAC